MPPSNRESLNPDADAEFIITDFRAFFNPKTPIATSKFFNINRDKS